MMQSKAEITQLDGKQLIRSIAISKAVKKGLYGTQRKTERPRHWLEKRHEP